MAEEEEARNVCGQECREGLGREGDRGGGGQDIKVHGLTLLDGLLIWVGFQVDYATLCR